MSVSIMLTIGTDKTVVEIEDMQNGRVRLQGINRQTDTKRSAEAAMDEVPYIAYMLRQCRNVAAEIERQLG